MNTFYMVNKDVEKLSSMYNRTFSDYNLILADKSFFRMNKFISQFKLECFFFVVILAHDIIECAKTLPASIFPKTNRKYDTQLAHGHVVQLDEEIVVNPDKPLILEHGKSVVIILLP